jgi:uncharacterized SAM-dependent methyltransferase
VIENFVHEAVYNENENRIEMYLISSIEQEVKIGDRVFSFSKNEKILTEYSHKYTIESIKELSKGLFNISKVWTDPKNYFAVVFLQPI